MTTEIDISGKMAGASEAELAAVLRWYVDMGVDIAVGDEPRNHFAEAKAKALAVPTPAPASVGLTDSSPAVAEAPRSGRVAPRLAPQTEPAPVRAASPASAVPPDEAIAAARAAAAGATTIETLKEALAAFDGCLLKRTAAHLVFAEGTGPAKVLFISDMPGSEDDREGRMFAGASGLLFDRMLKSIGLTRESVHLAHVVPWRPAGGKQPTLPEIATCLPFLQRYMALSAPQIIVTLGTLATQHVTGTKDPIMRARGKWFEIAVSDSQTCPAMAMFDPDYLRKAPATKKHTWGDLRALHKTLVEKGLV